jgi:hypothetical protein
MEAWLKRASNNGHTSSFSMPFTLDNGMEQLVPLFSKVTLTRYDDSLKVTEVEPILAYIHSLIRLGDLDKNEFVKIRVELEARLKQEKMIFITKDSGLFEAVK